MKKWMGMLIIAAVACSYLAGCQSRIYVNADGQELTVKQTRMSRKHEVIGDAFYERQRHQEAIQEWQIALELNPHEERLVRKIQAVKSGQVMVLDEKGEIINRSSGGKLSVSSNKAGIERAKARQYYERSQLREAAIAWQAVLTLDPDDAEAKNGLDMLKQESYRSDGKRSFDNMTESLYEEGMVFYRRKSWKQAKVKLAEAGKLSADQPQVRHYLSVVNKKLANIEAAEKIEHYAKQARENEGKKDWKEALMQWNGLLALAPDDQRGQTGRARCREELKKWADDRLMLADQAMGKRNYQEAKDHFKQVLTVFPSSSEAQKGLQKIARAARSNSERVSSKKYGERLFNEGVTCYRQGDYKKAVAKWKEAVKSDPENATYQEWLARGKKQLAQNRIDNNRQAEVRYADGLAAYQRGELEEALAAWKEALALNPAHEKAGINIKRIESELH